MHSDMIENLESVADDHALYMDDISEDMSGLEKCVKQLGIWIVATLIASAIIAFAWLIGWVGLR